MVDSKHGVHSAEEVLTIPEDASDEIAFRRVLSPVFSHHECVKRRLVLLTPVTLVRDFR